MKALRNTSNQALLLPKPGGGTLHLLPGRATTMSDEELAAPQVQQLLKAGLATAELLAPADARLAS